MASSSSAELTRSYSTTGGAILNSTRARPGLRPIALSTPANGSLRMPNPAKDQKREEKVLAKLPEICLGLPQAREVKTWRPTCRRSRVTKRRGAKARRQCRQGLRLPGKNSFRRPIRGWLRYPGGGGARYPGGGQTSTNQVKEYKDYVTSDTVLKLEDQCSVTASAIS